MVPPRHHLFNLTQSSGLSFGVMLGRGQSTMAPSVNITAGWPLSASPWPKLHSQTRSLWSKALRINAAPIQRTGARGGMGSKAKRNAPNYAPFTPFHVSPFGRSPCLPFRAFEIVCECVNSMCRLFRLQWVCEKAAHCDRIVILRVDHKQTPRIQFIRDGQKRKGQKSAREKKDCRLRMGDGA